MWTPLALAALVASIANAVPNYRPPEDILATLPFEWYRGIPSPDELANLHPRASSGQLESCLLSSDLEIVTPKLNSSEAFWDAAQSDNLHFHWHPSAIVYPRTAQQVSRAVTCAAQHGNVAVSPRSGGHSFAGSGSGGQDGSLIVDLKYLDHVTLRSDGNSADIGPGTRLGDVVKGLWKDGHEKAMPHGTCPPVGVGGHALCGGFGPTSRRWGMTTDNILQAEVVLANGSIVTANSGNTRELLWGLKGAGHNFGIVTNFRFQTYEARGPHVFFEYRWSATLKSGEEMARIVSAAQDFAQDNLPAEIGFHVQVQGPGNGDPTGGTLSLHIRGMYMGSLDDFQHQVISRLWKHMREHDAPQPEKSREEEMSYLRLMEEWDDFGSAGDKLDTIAERIHRNNFIARTAIAMSQRGFKHNTLKDAFQFLLDSQVRLNRQQPARVWSWNTYLEMYGGSNARHRAADIVAATSFPHRDGTWLIQSSIGTYGSHSFDSEAIKMIDALDDNWVGAIRTDGLERRAFTCYADSHLSESQWKELYFGGETLRRLERLKENVDPYNLFRNGQSLSGMKSKAVMASAGDGYSHDVHPLP